MRRAYGARGQARDVATYGGRAVLRHAFRRYCLRHRDALRHRNAAAPAPAGGGMGGDVSARLVSCDCGT